MVKNFQAILFNSADCFTKDQPDACDALLAELLESIEEYVTNNGTNNLAVRSILEAGERVGLGSREYFPDLLGSSSTSNRSSSSSSSTSGGGGGGGGGSDGAGGGGSVLSRPEGRGAVSKSQVLSYLYAWGEIVRIDRQKRQTARMLTRSSLNEFEVDRTLRQCHDSISRLEALASRIIDVMSTQSKDIKDLKMQIQRYHIENANHTGSPSPRKSKERSHECTQGDRDVGEDVEDVSAPVQLASAEVVKEKGAEESTGAGRLLSRPKFPPYALPATTGPIIQFIGDYYERGLSSATAWTSAGAKTALGRNKAAALSLMEKIKPFVSPEDKLAMSSPAPPPTSHEYAAWETARKAIPKQVASRFSLDLVRKETAKLEELWRTIAPELVTPTWSPSADSIGAFVKRISNLNGQQFAKDQMERIEKERKKPGKKRKMKGGAPEVGDGGDGLGGSPNSEPKTRKKSGPEQDM